MKLSYNGSGYTDILGFRPYSASYSLSACTSSFKIWI